MTIVDEVSGGVPPGAATAMTAGLATMGAPNLDIIVTTDFVAKVRSLTGETHYHDDRNGGMVAARTIETQTGDVAVVANWNALHDATIEEIERVLAHEAGHAAILERGEDIGAGIADRFAGNFWDIQIAHGASVAIEEYRCEAAVYKAGYSAEKGRTDPGLSEELFGLNIQLLEADHKYQEHLDVARLRDEVLMIVLLNLRYMGCVAARHIHHAPVVPANLNKHACANWKALIAPTWGGFIDRYSVIPDALTPWPDPAGTEAVAAAVPLIRKLTGSFGYRAGKNAVGGETFHIIMTPQTRQIRINRANAEAAFYDLTE